ncbi:SH3 domain of the SH3b1 type [Legionella lansingensis]|uniref:SH3 domain of the SH3b1 type n=1 Tax=Legionella lansingensis TaxID=45067 RepID=A0A0W0VPS9_9GAMM|nr:SH3 domain-containing protein [Legionella lansingensis]KTD22155.1 SH3 domain of the SH3b1 type [Legionella lansingensis]SNV54557.1 SH3 domain of the SH3b1 type [Legionella lansingensis]
MRQLSYITSFILCVLFGFVTESHAIEVPIYDFSIKAYNQDINTYLPKESDDYNKRLIKPEYQAAQLQQFFNHYYSSDNQGLSPWSEQLVQNLLPTVKKIELAIIDDFDNQKQDPINYHYAENFKEHDEIWLNKIINNMNLGELNSTAFNNQNRAIVVQNTFARALPDGAPDFFHLSLAGQGFPFDNLQESALWAGTPLYVLHVSKDKAWSLVLTPDAYFAWVKSNDIAYASAEFINQWNTKARKGLIAITQTETSVVDNTNQFLFKGYIGAVFPLVYQGEESTIILVPRKNKQQQAVIGTGIVNKNAAQPMPVPATKHNMASLIKQLQNRPYGWGGTFFFNDCSQELKSLFAPLGIWLPRNSLQQAQYVSLDLSEKTLDERLSTLATQGHPLMTLIYTGGHVMLYIGNQRQDNQTLIPITYQNVWGLKPSTKDKRYVIGQSLLFPLLKYYPEYPDATSLANSSYFKLIFLDELSSQPLSSQNFVKQFTKNASVRDLQ